MATRDSRPLWFEAVGIVLWLVSRGAIARDLADGSPERAAAVLEPAAA